LNTPWQIELFGWLRAQQGERVVSRFYTKKHAALFAYLAFFHDRGPVSREVLIELLWPECALQAGRNRLKVALSSLRHQLEPPGVPGGAVILADRASVQLNPAAVATDVARFQASLQAAARAASSTERIHRLIEAVDLYRGELLPGYYEAWILPERECLAEMLHQALSQLVTFAEQAGDHRQALQWARRAVSIDPLRVEAHHDLIRLLAAAGQPEVALRHYQELEQILARELGVEPVPEIQTTVEEIRRSGVQAFRRSGKTFRTPERLNARPPERSTPAPLPTGSVTFLLSDITGSSEQGNPAGDLFTEAMVSCHSLLRELFRRHGGHEVMERRDAFLVAFARAGDALACAIAAQRALAEHPPSESGRVPPQAPSLRRGGCSTLRGVPGPEGANPLRVRLALHTGDVELQEGEYWGPELHVARQVLLAGHGGQILCSESTAGLLRRNLKEGVRFVDLGLYRLPGVSTTERLVQVEYPDTVQREFPPLKAEAGYAGDLPVQFTRFFGREEEIARLRELLLATETRLVTLTGSGGTGKTRLALAAAERLRMAFEGAIWFIPLADLADADLIPSKALEALRLQRSPSVEPLEQVVHFLSRQPSLLLLDNFEHLVSDGASFVRTLLERVPTLTCLVTSRQRLDLAGEREVQVGPLPVPETARGKGEGAEGNRVHPENRLPLAPCPSPEALLQCASVRLFVDRAQAVRPDFQVTAANAAVVTALCARLEGLPLAIELAAARAGVLTPQQMLARLERRFELLVRRGRPADPRHRSLRAALDWSYQLLSSEVQRFFRQLSVFRGGWTLEAAAAVCEEPAALECLEQLRESSLMVAEEAGPEIRYRVLETLREFGAEQLGPEERVALERRHGTYYRALAEAAEPHLTRADQVVWFERLEREHNNFRAALRWSVEQREAETGLRLGGALKHFWEARGYQAEGLASLAELLALPEAAKRTAVRAKALMGASRLAGNQGDFTVAQALAEESLAIGRELGDEETIASSLFQLGYLAHIQGDQETARALCEESLKIGQRLGSTQVIAFSLFGLGKAARFQGDYETAWALFEECLTIYRELGDRRNASSALNYLGDTAVQQDNYPAAQALYEESLALKRELGDNSGIAATLRRLGDVALLQGDCETARRFYEESLSISREVNDKGEIAGALSTLARVASEQGDYRVAQAFLAESVALWRERGNTWWGIHECLAELAGVALGQGQAARAARLFGATEALFGAISAPQPAAEQGRHERQLASIRAALGDEAFAAAWAAGRAMSLDEAIAEALANREGWART
jgi:predicted ATPase/DNA-binding SARP family transcriptional activator